MQLDRLTYEPGALASLFEEGLTALGALCERTWHDRVEIVAEGRAARLWNADGALHATELAFVPGDARSARDAAREVFPGCPLTFRLAEILRPAPLPLERVLLGVEAYSAPPDLAVAEKRWRAQFPNTTRWRLAAEFKPDYHFSLVSLVRCEIQAIDQHWSLHRLAVALSDGEPDDALAREVGFAQLDSRIPDDLAWPTPQPDAWQVLLRTALEADLADELATIRRRQEAYLRREIERVDSYFEHYEQELSTRAARSGSQNARVKTADRLAAAKAEHTRRRADQVARHEIRVQTHVDALLLVAEPAWRGSLDIELAHRPQSLQMQFVPRTRQWFRC